MAKSTIKKDVIKKTILNAFVTDSFVLPAHWCYITEEIQSTLVPAGYFGNKLLPPGLLNDYHKPKDAGAQTHYGDQMFWLLEHLGEGQVLKDWPQKWLKKITEKGYVGYKDGASKDTIANWEKGLNKGKDDTNDLAGVSRFTPLLALLPKMNMNKPEFINLIQQQAEITHANPNLKDIPSLFGSWALKVQENPDQKPSEIFKSLSIPDSLRASVEKALKLGTENDFESVNSLGEIKDIGGKKIATARSCSATVAVPVCIYLIFKYETLGLFEALKANSLIGGDSAARGILLATILSPYSEHCHQTLPDGWYEGLKLKSSIESLLEKLVE